MVLTAKATKVKKSPQDPISELSKPASQFASQPPINKTSPRDEISYSTDGSCLFPRITVIASATAESYGFEFGRKIMTWLALQTETVQ